MANLVYFLITMNSVPNLFSFDENSIDERQYTLTITRLIKATSVIKSQFIHPLYNSRERRLRFIQRHEGNLQNDRACLQERLLAALNYAIFIALHIQFYQNARF